MATGVAPTGDLTPFSGAKSLVMHLPAGKQLILADESNTAGLGSMPHWAEGPPHDSINQTGGAIGIGTTLAVGVAAAAGTTVRNFLVPRFRLKHLSE